MSAICQQLSLSYMLIMFFFKFQDEIRCNLEFSERNLLVTFIKKDEGFESDTESAKSLEVPAVAASKADPPGETGRSATDEKIIKDHVFGFADPPGIFFLSRLSGLETIFSFYKMSVKNKQG